MDSPGAFVRAELQARGWSQADLAVVLGRPPRLVSEIINDRRTITAKTAKELGAAFDQCPMLWMRRVTEHQLATARPHPRNKGIPARLAIVEKRHAERRQCFVLCLLLAGALNHTPEEFQ